MNSNENKEQQVEVLDNQVEEQDYKTLQAEVIGELRKEKIGKPSLVFKIFGILLVVLIVLPFINTMLNDENSKLYKYIHRNDVSDIVEPTTKDEFLDASKPQLLTSQTAMKYDTIILKNITLSDSTLKATIYSYNGLVNLDLKDYYLEITSNNDVLSYIKLTGILDFQEKEVEYKVPNFNANNTINYYGRIYEITDNDYQEITLNQDESGIAYLTCSKDNKVMKYTFKNGYLINLEETYNLTKTMENEETYNNTLKSYTSKKNLLSEYAILNEQPSSFSFTSNINLETKGYMLPDDLTDYDYYPLDTQAKAINYKEVGKGYDCK